MKQEEGAAFIENDSWAGGLPPLTRRERREPLFSREEERAVTAS
jgi:hypothetical protein